MISRTFIVTALVAVLVAVLTPASAFAPQPSVASQARGTTAVLARKPKEDLSYIETRDMTREEMLALNAKNEEIMNMELGMMTGFSLVISIPILYLCWVAFFSD